jgi:hypothetical protein
MKKTKKVMLTVVALMSLQSASVFAADEVHTTMGDKLKILCDGVISYYNNPDRIDTYGPKLNNGTPADTYWDNYTRLRFDYKIDSHLSFTARLHGGYDAVSNEAPNTNKTNAGWDQAFMLYRDKQSNMSYKVGKQGQYMGQGMVFDSTGNWTGVNIAYGDWTQPTNIQFCYWDSNSGNPLKAIDISQNVLPNVALSATYLDLRGASSTTVSYIDPFNTVTVNGIKYPVVSTYQQDNGTWSDKIISLGARAKIHGATVLGERAHNNSSSGPDSTGYYAEVYTGPTNDMTSGLPFEKVGTEVVSLRYQDIGKSSVYAPVPGMYAGFKGWRVNYGRVLTKGVSADIAFSHMQQKNDPTSQNRNLVVGEIAFKM